MRKEVKKHLERLGLEVGQENLSLEIGNGHLFCKVRLISVEEGLARFEGIRINGFVGNCDVDYPLEGIGGYSPNLVTIMESEYRVPDEHFARARMNGKPFSFLFGNQHGPMFEVYGPGKNKETKRKK